jgi:outer membrane protein assembly factor BamE (lipoprotein component of BamABCDE complex)
MPKPKLSRLSMTVRAIPFLTPLLLAGCGLFSTPPQYRGVAVTDAQLKQLTPGVSTEADANALLGPPTAHEMFADDNWIYASQITKMRIGNVPGVEGQHVVVLHFDQNGVLRAIDQYGMHNRVHVAMAPGATPVPGGSASFMQLLVGGVGHYNPGFGAGQGGTIGAPSP